MSDHRGSSLVELLFVLSMMGIMMGIGMSNLTVLNNPLQDTTNEVAGFLKQARARAIATTSAYTVQPTDSRHLATKYGKSCDDLNTTVDAALRLELPDTVKLNDTHWSVCFSPRGLTTTSPVIYFTGGNNAVRSIEVYLGGAVRVS